MISAVVNMAGWAAVISTSLLAIFCLLSVLQIAMVNSKDRVVVNYSFAVMAKLALSLLASKSQIYPYKLPIKLEVSVE